MDTRKDKRIVRVSLMFLCLLLSSEIQATPNSIIWIPSADYQNFGTFHLGIDNYIRTKNDKLGVRGSGIYDFGLTAGILPFKKFQGEIGVDYLSMGDGVFDNHPVYFNAKLVMIEGTVFKGSPALAVGGYNFGLKKDLTNFNIFYAIVSKTIPVIGRFEAGCYSGNGKILVGTGGEKSNSGMLLSWDRNMKEISDKLSFGFDYQGGNNFLSSWNWGVTWSFTDKVSVIFGYDLFKNQNVRYNSKNYNVNTFNTQLDINF